MKDQAGAREGLDLCVHGKTWPWASAACQQSIFSITLRIHKHYISGKGPLINSGQTQKSQQFQFILLFFYAAIKMCFENNTRIGICTLTSRLWYSFLKRPNVSRIISSRLVSCKPKGQLSILINTTCSFNLFLFPGCQKLFVLFCFT